MSAYCDCGREYDSPALDRIHEAEDEAEEYAALLAAETERVSLMYKAAEFHRKEACRLRELLDSAEKSVEILGKENVGLRERIDWARTIVGRMQQRCDIPFAYDPYWEDKQ